MKIVSKKILPEYFNAVEEGTKTFELRKDEDNIQPGDLIKLREWDRGYTGRKVIVEATYVLRHMPCYGLMEGYCIIGIRKRGN